MNKLFSLKKLILLGSFFVPLFLFAQKEVKPKPNWQNLDLKTDGMFGISTEKAYTDLLAGKIHVPVVVAVIDGGVDINHEDLKKIIWNNPKETPGNNADDDHNGYVDDIHGWDFIGSAKGDVEFDNLELTRQLRDNQAKYEYANTANLTPPELVIYQNYQKMKDDLNKRIEKAQKTLKNITDFKAMLTSVTNQIGKENPTVEDFRKFDPQTNGEAWIKKTVLENTVDKSYADFVKDDVDEGFKYYNEQLKYHLNRDYDPRAIVGDNYTDSNERSYGNNDVNGPDAHHGTHVSGIIGAVRDNDLGIKGIANDVMIMSVRTVPNGDERDKDVANAIRYAAANGAKVINMSFGKDYSYDKKAVDDAVKFAMSQDVLIVHAAGNDNRDNDKQTTYPNRNYADNSGQAAAWIEVGASGFIDDETLKATFSSFGKTSVDVFAPGYKILSTTPNSTYKEYSGTSMAAPVVVGLATLIRSYYPKLTAVQVKEIILKSVVKVDHKVTYKVGEKNKKIAFADLCQTGGIVNAYEALKLAATY